MKRSEINKILRNAKAFVTEKKLFHILGVSIIALACACNGSENKSISGDKDTIVTLNNAEAVVSFSKWGGALVNFHIANDSINPFTWSLQKDDMPVNNKNGAPFRGHFLCTGRWGSPTPGEITSGIPHNGEPSNVWWHLKEQASQSLVMRCTAKLEGFEVERRVSLSSNAPLLIVTEEFLNKLNIIRNLPIVQHATLAAPFLDTLVKIQSNASKGFNQKFVPGNFLKYESNWPFLTVDTLEKMIDLRKSNYKDGFVGTYIISDSIGWVTAYNPGYRLLLGYVWKTNDYRWLHIWQGTKDGKLIAKGLEFGTTGLGDTSPLEERFLLNFYGYTNLNYVDANSSVKKSYVCFLMKLEKEFEEINNILLTQDNLTIKFKEKGKENIKIIPLD